MSFNMYGFEDLEKQLSAIEDIADDVADEMIDSATPILKEELKKCIRQVTTEEYSTGKLAESIIATKSKVNGYGHFAAVMPTGKDSKGVRNGEKMAYLEFGTSKQNAKPILGKAIARAKPECEKTMQEKFDEALESLMR